MLKVLFCVQFEFLQVKKKSAFQASYPALVKGMEHPRCFLPPLGAARDWPALGLAPWEGGAWAWGPISHFTVT